MFDFLQSKNGLITVCLIFVVLLVMLFIAVKKGIKICGKNGGVMLGGENDEPIAKLSKQISDISKTIKTLIEKSEKSDGDFRALRSEVKKENNEQMKVLRRLEIISNELPPIERMRAYDEYRRIGGNGWIEEYVNKKKAEWRKRGEI